MSSRRRMLKRGRWRLMKLCSASSASASVAVTRVSMRSIARGQAGVAAGEVGGDPFADRARLADVEQLAVAVVEEVDAGLSRAATGAARRSARRASGLLVFCRLRSSDPKGRLPATQPNPTPDRESEMTSQTVSPPELNTLQIEIDGEIGTLTLEPARRLQRDEPGDDRRADRRLRLARRPGAAARADRDRRRQGLLRRRRRHLVPQRGRRRGDRPARRASAAAPRSCTRRSSTCAASPTR